MATSLRQMRTMPCTTAGARQCRPVAFAPVRSCKHVHTTQCRATGHGNNVGMLGPEDQKKMEILMNRFKMADVDGNGTIDREELRNLLESVESGEVYLMSQHWLPEDDLDSVMDKYDTNKDGVISFEEFQQIVYDGLLLDGELGEYEAAFRAVDRSGNGTIGANELAALFASMGQPMSLEKLVDVMQAYDKDESGQIEFREFLLMFRNKVLDLKAMKDYMTGTLNGNQVFDYLASDLGASTTSGSVVEPIEGGLTLIFSEEEMNEIIAKNPNKLIVVFGALTWCRPCKGMQRPMQRIAEHYKSSILVLKLFGNANAKTKALFKERFKVRSTPCFIAMRNGEVVYSQTGSNKEKLEAGLRACVPNPPVGMVYPSADAVTAPAPA